MAYLYAQRDPAALVHDAAANARRAVLGGMTLTQALAAPQDALADALRKRIHAALEHARIGVALVDVTLKGVRVPTPVQGAFDDEQKAQQQREALQRDARAYAADVVPRAQAQAAQMIEQAQVYAQRVVTRAQGDSARFELVLKQYRKAPEVTREALYLQTMQDILGRVTKVVVPHGSVIQLPAPRASAAAAEPAAPPASAASAASAPAPAASLPRPSDSLRDSLRERAFR
ncbi:modulator of FtsH protease HflK [mine drainage metagenome]|uniref:Modulator of FtsH protease HflK n=1 Tax=mine drainage metagenome TaxID=410659 RepID=A0A1J5QZA3_9ZZZZ